MITGRSASARSLATRAERIGIGLAGRMPDRRRPPTAVSGRGPVEELVDRDVDEARPPRRGRPPRSATRRPPAQMSPVLAAVTARLVTSATIGTWSTSWREPDPQRAAGARPPMTTIGRPAEERAGDGAHPVGDAGPGGEGGHAGLAGDLGPPLGGEPGRLLVAGVDQADAGRDAPVVEREDVAAGEGEDDVDAGRPCSAAGRQGAAVDELGGRSSPEAAISTFLSEIPDVVRPFPIRLSRMQGRATSDPSSRARRRRRLRRGGRPSGSWPAR